MEPGGRWYPLYTETDLDSFALRARPTVDTQLCTSMLDATCPEIYGRNYLSVYNSCSGVPCLDVTNSRFQDQWIVLTANLPAAYTCGGNCWWKVSYTPISAAAVTDRTTWSVRIIGDPIHLTE